MISYTWTCQGCCHRIIEAKCKRVYIGAMEPAHFQICEGVRIMQEAGIDVVRLTAREHPQGTHPARIPHSYAIIARLLFDSTETAVFARTAGLEEECLAPNKHVLSS